MVVFNLLQIKIKIILLLVKFKNISYNNYKDYKIRLNAPNETICTNGTRCIILNEYQDIIETAVPIEKSMELLSGKIGEDCDVNTEISSEITQGSETL